jgi:Arc/MetJ-type ribon-helix-helix transcriptional regulator
MDKTEEGTKNISVSLYPSQVREAEVLVKKGYYHNTSEMVRVLIDREYRVKVKDAKEELQKQLAEKEELIKSLAALVAETETVKISWIEKYAEKRKHLDIQILASPAKYTDAMRA